MDRQMTDNVSVAVPLSALCALRGKKHHIFSYFCFCEKFSGTFSKIKGLIKNRIADYHAVHTPAMASCTMYCQVFACIHCRLDPNPWILLGHFFAVALYAVYHVFKTQSWWLLHRSVYRSTRVFLSACSIIFPLIWSEVKTVLRL